MSKQIAMEDLLNMEAVAACEKFLHNAAQEDAEMMPRINTRHEAYGILASANQYIQNAVATLKSDMGDALKTLAMDDVPFMSAADGVRASLVELAQAVVYMYEHAENITVQMYDKHLAETPAPLLDLVNDLPGDDSEAME